MSTAPAKIFPVDGRTDVYMILGDPVEQVRAPESFNLIFAALGMNAVVVPAHVAIADVTAFVKTVFTGRNIKGLLLTIPHKSVVMPLLARCGPLAQVAGAVNALRLNAEGELEGDLFDGEGLVSSLNYFGMVYAGRRVLVLGAGGGAAAIGASLVGAGSQVALGAASELAFYDPTPGKAQELAQRLSGHSTRVSAAASNDPAGYDLVINATPLGLKTTDAMPCDAARVEPHAAMMDILMKNQPTPWVRAGRARGLNAQPGFEMMIQQADLYLEFFGLSDAAARVKRDATFIRESIYPAELAGEIKRP
ncbi:shikimate dehydrogenase [Rhodoferax koreense]|uniref:Shikimate dehydrogenase n=1 Tax=Rhodoferax koreensis TaxID=1842727 RepID=A0A1P8K3R2_9BURK|nr:shikimate dehydrogenase [Rhodoferax koreense]APW40643.1 shikimate dehydrogenase [Rhodoferax koreense]